MIRLPTSGRRLLGLVVLAHAAGGCTGAPPREAESDEPVLPATPDEFVAGQTLYDAKCSSCHDTSKEGAPRLGFLRAWKRRLVKGEDALVATAIEGVDLMPPRGDNPELTDDEVRSIVQYMIYRAGLDIPAG